MTPFEINLLLSIHVSPAAPRVSDAPIYKGTIDDFLRNGLIVATADTESGYKTTDRGYAHVEQLCSLSWPTQAWIGANGKIIDGLQ